MTDDATDLDFVAPNLTPVGLALPKNISFKNWLIVGEELARREKTLAWAIADWWAFGSFRYGERANAVSDLPFSVEVCMTYASVARAFSETSRRLEVLTFGHHQTVAGLDPADADELLAWAASSLDNGGRAQPIRELRERVRLLKQRRAAEGNVVSLGITPASIPPPSPLAITEEAAKSAIDTAKLIRRDPPVSEAVKVGYTGGAVKGWSTDGLITKGNQRLPDGFQHAVTKEDWLAVARIVVRRIPLAELADFGAWLLAHINDLRSRGALR